jgi:hypothetical protein
MIFLLAFGTPFWAVGSWALPAESTLANGSPSSLDGSPILLDPAQADVGNFQKIPKDSAIVGKTLLDIILDPNRKYDLPVTMLTTLPVYSESGQAALPVNTIITAFIKKREGGAYIVIDKVVYKGLSVKIPSEGRLIPAQIKPENYGQYFIPPKPKFSSVFDSVANSNLVSTLLGIALAGNNQSNITPLLIGVLGADVGIRFLSAVFDASPKQIPPLVEIPRDSLIVFTVSEEVSLPISAGPDTAFPVTP